MCKTRIISCTNINSSNCGKVTMLKNDESILFHICGKDGIAVEAKYHKKC